ncbi:hypothetical protein TrCOL_g4481 [Triparma columacea]|uniref:2-(3-amino-3-carboxypropyl)histidine synthase subunit 2 n=1 Tax=Triparma columacea TaxID=722753 RepID=A0A9W7FXJ9_9STRA|nr:hypothetical protein TrCOL_g4481 [Triparma columacea]
MKEIIVFCNKEFDISTFRDVVLGGGENGGEEDDIGMGFLVVFDVGYDWVKKDVEYEIKKRYGESTVVVLGQGIIDEGDTELGNIDNDSREYTLSPEGVICTTLDLFPASTLKVCGLTCEVPKGVEVKELTLLYLGEPTSPSIQNALMELDGTSGTYRQWIYDPPTNHLELDLGGTAGRKLSRRYRNMMKARSSLVVGIVVATLNVSRFRDVVDSLKDTLERDGRTVYTLSVGKITLHKLSNFDVIETFVIVGCPNNSVLESRDFHVPVVTPWEMMRAVKGDGWEGWNAGFGRYLEGMDEEEVERERGGEGGGGGDYEHDNEGNREGDGNNNDDEDDDGNDDDPYFDVVTGSYKQKVSAVTGARALDLSNLPGGGAVTEYRSEAAEWLGKREYQGLENQKVEVREATKGRKGVASGYEALGPDKYGGVTSNQI